MADKKLWLKNSDIPELTSISGNIDAASLLPHIYTAQTTEIKRILGLKLYNYIDEKIQAGTALDGTYLELFNEYVIDILVYYSAMNYMKFGGYKTAQSGIYKVNGDGVQTVDQREINHLVDAYRQLAVSSENQFYVYMKDKNLTEYPQSTDDGQGNVIGWF